MSKNFLINNLIRKQWNCDYSLQNCVRRYLSTKNDNLPRTRAQDKIQKIFNKENRLSTVHKIDPSDTSIILFPGQGSQFVGMVSNIFDSTPNIAKLFKVSEQILGYDLLDICLNGPMEKLSRTEYCQPAVFVSSLAAVEYLRATKLNEVESCVATAGFSIGEITSLVFAGSMSFEDGLRLVNLRAQAMQVASEVVPSGMATVFLSADATLGRALEASVEWCKRQGIDSSEAVCSIANYLFPNCKVIGGHEEALRFIQMNGKDFGIKRMRRLPVSGAFHTALMTKETQEVLRDALDNIDIEQPQIRCYSNYDGKPHRDPANIRKNLILQISKPVRWEQILHRLYDRSEGVPYPITYECGPGNALLATLQMVNREAKVRAKNVKI